MTDEQIADLVAAKAQVAYYYGVIQAIYHATSYTGESSTAHRIAKDALNPVTFISRKLS
jgi:hypothetical protein